MKPACSCLLLVLLLLPAGAADPSEPTESWTPPADARERLERILQDPVFLLEQPEPGFLERFSIQIRQFLFRILERAVEVMELNAILVRAILWLVIGLTLAGAVWMVVRTTRDRLAVPDADRSGEGPVSRPAREPSATALLESAVKAVGSGNGRAGLRLCLQACLTTLRAAGHLPDNRSMTDLEGAEHLERSGPADLQGPFRALARSHDRLVYAGKTPEAGELDRALELAGTIVSARGERP